MSVNNLGRLSGSAGLFQSVWAVRYDCGRMEYRTLGNTGLRLSILGFGAAPLGNEYGDIQTTEGERAVHAAIDHGINFFDTSPYYGRTLSEERLGMALTGKRDKVVL